MDFRSILKQHRSELALIIGNGINRYGNAKDTNSWQSLLSELAKDTLPGNSPVIPEGMSLTEYFDILDLLSGNSKSAESLQKQFCGLMNSWKPFAHHTYIVDWAKRHNVPILTTNFETTLSDAAYCKLYRTKNGGFTAYYPWESYYSLKKIVDPLGGFSVWHINGMARYSRSIRLGMTHYMGSVQRARSWFHRGKNKRLFAGNNIQHWKGAQTWLQIIFNKPLVIFGLGLEKDEIFLRWLLIERARYYKKFPESRKLGWYIETEPLKDASKRFFLENVGFEILEVDDYNGIYGNEIWR